MIAIYLNKSNFFIAVNVFLICGIWPFSLHFLHRSDWFSPTHNGFLTQLLFQGRANFFLDYIIEILALYINPMFLDPCYGILLKWVLNMVTNAVTFDPLGFFQPKRDIWILQILLTFPPRAFRWGLTLTFFNYSAYDRLLETKVGTGRILYLFVNNHPSPIFVSLRFHFSCWPLRLGHKRPKDGEIDRGSPRANTEVSSMCSIHTCLHASVLARVGNVRRSFAHFDGASIFNGESLRSISLSFQLFGVGLPSWERMSLPAHSR